MGLAASQARLLTITARKSDCEYESMRLSHQKIALSREMNEISNEYQNSLNKTNLFYDFYGIGDTSNPLTYSLLMTPSALNDYLPTLITNQQGRVVLDSKYAAAARAAGIPQEGLGSLPSDDVRNAFVEALFQNGIISSKTRDAIQSVAYNQGAGLGNTDLVNITTEEGNIETLKNIMLQCDTEQFYTTKLVLGHEIQGAKDDMCTPEVTMKIVDGSNANDVDETSFRLYDLLFGTTQYNLDYSGDVRSEQSPVTATAMMQKYLTDGGFVDYLFSKFSEFLDTGDVYTQNALEYARNELNKLINPAVRDSSYEALQDKWYNTTGNSDWDDDTQWKRSDVNQFLDPVGTRLGTNPENYNPNVVKQAGDYIGFVYVAGNKGSDDDGNDHCTGGLNLNNLAKAFLTYFATYMSSVTNSEYNVEIGNKNKSNLVTDDLSFMFTIKTGETISADDAKMALFYDTLFNQLCTTGWTENNEVNDKEYLQEMLKNGMMYISTIGDDSYYSQGNYSTNTYIKEITDDSATTAAEAKYQTQKARL